MRSESTSDGGQVVAKTAAVAVSTLGLSVLAGWLLGVEQLKRIVPGLVAMNPMTAMLFMVCAVALWARAGRPTNLRRRIGTLGAAVVASAGIIKLGQYVFHWEWAIDQWMFSHKLRAEQNQMAPNTALNFALVGLALLLLDARGRAGSWFAQATMWGAAGFSLLAVIGYAYGVHRLYVLSSFIPMALHTALAFLIVSAGLLWLRPQQGLIGLAMSRSAAGLLVRRLLPGVILIPAVLGWFRLAGERGGLYGPATGTALFVMTNIVLFVALVWWTARLLHRIDVERRRAIDETRDLYDNAPCGYHSVDGEGRFVRMNRTELNWLGYRLDEIIGRRFSEVITEKSRQTFAKSFPRFMEQGHIENLEFEMVREDGSILPVMLSATAVKDQSGRFVMSRSVIHDMTAQKQAEAALNRLREAADAANAAKSDFLANMSHEIRTPMTAIIGYADLLLDPDQSPSDRVDAVGIIRRNAEHLLMLINDTLDLSKIEAGAMTVERVDCRLGEIFSEVASLMRMRAAEKELKFEVRYDGAVPETIRSDPTRVRQILINLVGNAIKFTETGGVHLVASMDAEAPADAPRLRIEVIDSGIGMTDAQIANLFRPFTQADSSTTRRFGGTGLGLTISKRLARLLGGDIAIQSRQGCGTRLIVTLETGALEGVRMLTDPSEAVQRAEELEAGRHQALPQLRGRVLLADDGVDNRSLLGLYLRKAGAVVEVAENGRRCCEMALAAVENQQPFDVILMDMQMPELDGYGATSQLRSKGYRGPIIALTAHALASDREKCLRSGCTDYLSKPVSRRKLIETVARHMAHEHPPDESALEDDVRDLLPGYLKRLDEQAQQLVALHEQGQLEQLAAVVHQLKGTAGLYGFAKISEAATRTEEQLGEEAIESALQKVKELVELIRATTERATSFEANVRGEPQDRS